MTTERRLAAILSADVVGYSRLMAEDEAGTIRTIGTYREQIAGLVTEHRGRVVDTAGDSVLAEFPTALDAVECAVEVQRVLAARNAGLAEDRRMDFRIGLHLGDVTAEGDRIYGDGVNLAARLEALATAGGICVSESVRSEVRDKLGLGYRDLGAQEVKNLPEPVHAYAIELGAHAPSVAARHPRRNALWIAAAFVLLAAVAAALWTFDRDPGVDPSDPPSLAVLPFNNMSGDSEQEYFSDGITEDLITDLSRVPGLLVIARNSTFTYKGRAVNVSDVGRELGVRYVLEGSVRKAGDRVRVNAQLVDAATGHHLWAQRYDRDLEDIFAVQDELTGTIVAALEVHITERDPTPPTRDLEAYDIYLRAISLNVYDKPSAIQARELLNRAIELDPQFARAHAALALNYVLLWVRQMSENAADVERAVELADKAVQLAPDDSETRSRAGIAYQLAARYDEALTNAKRAIELNPNDAAAYLTLGLVLNHHGRPEEALPFLEEAHRRSPQDPSGRILFQMGVASYWSGRQDEGIARVQKCVQRNPNAEPCRLSLGYMYYELGDEAKARAEFEEVFRINPRFTIDEWARRLPIKGDALDGIVAAWRALEAGS